MQRYGMVLGLKAAKVAEYKRLHAAVWPDILRQIADCHIRNYSIYLRRLPGGRHYLFSYFEYVGADARLEFSRRAFGNHHPVVDHGDPVGELVGLLEVLRRQEDRHAEVVVEAPHLLPDRRPAGRVEAGRRLVEEEDARIVYQREGQVQPALHASGVRAGALLRIHVVEADRHSGVAIAGAEALDGRD